MNKSQNLFTEDYYNELDTIHRNIEDVIMIIKADYEEDLIMKIKRLIEEETGRSVSVNTVKQVISEKNINIEDI